MAAEATPKATKATYAQIEALPPNSVGEILGGELVVSPRPAPRHANAAGSVGGILHPAFHRGNGGPGGWWIIPEPELHLADDVIVPDVGGWRRTRMLHLPETAWFELAPDWACEVLSPSTARRDRSQKMAIYAREQVPHLWLVDPVAETLEVFGLQAGRWVILGVHAGDAKVRAEPFDAIEIDLAALWG